MPKNQFETFIWHLERVIFYALIYLLTLLTFFLFQPCQHHRFFVGQWPWNTQKLAARPAWFAFDSACKRRKPGQWTKRAQTEVWCQPIFSWRNCCQNCRQQTFGKNLFFRFFFFNESNIPNSVLLEFRYFVPFKKAQKTRKSYMGNLEIRSHELKTLSFPLDRPKD